MNAQRLFPVALAAVLAAAGLVASADGPDDIAFRRVALRPGQLAAELEGVRLGVWRQMPLDQFDDLARRAAAPPPERPRLLETRYRARLDEESLVGSAAWTIRHVGDAPGLLPVDPLQVAVRRAAWEGGRPATFGELDARPQSAGVELLVDRAGDRALAVDWSARGVPEPAGLRFDLRLPACPLAVLELELPDDVEPSAVRDGAVLTGPWPSANDARLWRVAFGPSTQLDLTLRRRAPAADAPIVLARQRNRQELAPASVACDYVLEYEVARGAVSELALECDAGLRPTEVTARNLRGWTAGVGLTPGATRVVATLTEPTLGGVLTLRGTSTVPDGAAWSSPAVRVVGGVSRGEALTLRVHADVRLVDWRGGGFRIADAAAGADGVHTLQLQSAAGRGGGRPSVRVVSGGPDYTVRERLWWHVGAVRTTVTAELTFAIARGAVERVPLALPAGWSVDRVEFGRPDAGAAFAVSPDRSAMTLTWPRAVTGGALTATVVLTRTTPRGEALPFPDLVPLAARGREGVLALHVAPDLESTTRGPAALPPDAEPAAAAPWADAAPPTATYALPRGAVEGVLQVAPVRPGYTAAAVTRVGVAGRGVRVEHELRVEPAAGAPDAVVLFVPTAGREPWNWQVVRGGNRVRSAVRWPAGPPPISWFAAASTWDAVALAGARDPAAWWRVALERPLTEAIELKATLDLALPAPPHDRAAAAAAPLATAGGLAALVAAGAAPAAGHSWAVPLVRTPAAQREVRDIDITLRSPGWEVRATDATEVPTAEGSPGRCRFRADGPLARVELVPASANRGTVDGACVASTLREDGGCDHELTFRLWDWPAAEVAVGLPDGITVRSATVDGHATRPERGSDARWRLPVPFGRRVILVTVRFGTTGPGPWSFWSRLEAPDVELPRGGCPVPTAWHLPPGVAALDGGASSPVVVRPRSLALVGFVAAVVCYVGVRGAQRRWPLVACLAAAAAAAVVAPPAVADAVRLPLYALVLAAVWAVIPRRPAAPAPLAAAALAAWLGVPGRAAAPAKPIVYLVPGAGGAEAQTVLAPPDLLDRLAARARAASPPAFVAPVEASYDGRIDGGSAHFQATLAVEANADGLLSLPFAGALLRGARLDGAATFPRTSGDRLTFAVTGRGRHRLELDFAVPCPEGGERELRFAVAETPTCSLTLRLPGSARYVQAAGRRGHQRLTDDVGARRLEVDLGRAGAATVRWRQDAPNPAPASVAVREAYLWDLHPTWATLLGALRYTVGGGVAALDVDIPPGLEVTSVSARPLDAPGAAGASPWLRGWHVANVDGSRRLQLSFSAPVTGNWIVLLELVPDQPFGPTFALSVPSAAGATAAAPTVLAWRAADFAPQAARVQGWTMMPTDDFLREAWAPARVEPDPRPPARAFRRALAGMPAILRLSVPAAEPAAADLLASWRVAARRADVTWSLRLSAAGKTAVVECDVPVAVELADVTGPEVFAWSRTGPRVQAWLRRPVEAAELTLTGSVARRAEAVRFEAPALRPVGATVAGTLRVSAADGLALTPVLAQQLEAAPDTGRGGREWEYRFRQAAVRAAFQVRPAAGTSDFRADTAVAWADDRPAATTTVSARVRRGELRNLTVTAARTEGWEVAVDAPGSEQVREVAPSDHRRAWVIDLPPGVTAEYRVSVTARGPSGAGEWTVPDVSVRVPDPKASRFERFVALAGPGWRVVNADRLTALSPHAWQATHDEARLVVARADGAANEPSVVVASEEVSLARAADGRWLARARYRLKSGGGELRASWPEPVQLVAAVRDGLALPVPPAATRDYVVRLPGAGSGCDIGLTWEAAAGAAPAAVAGPTLTAGGAVAVGRRAAVIVPPPGASVEADGERVGGLGASAGALAAPFDSLFDGAAGAVHFRPRAGWPLRLEWSPPPPHWPLTAAKLLGVALLLGLACVMAWRPRGPVWPFALLLLGAGLAVVDSPWLGLVPAAAGAAAGATLALSDRTRLSRRPDDAVEAAPDGV